MLTNTLFSTSDTPRIILPDDGKPKRSIAQEIIQKSQDIKQEHYRIIERDDPTPPKAQKPSKKDEKSDPDAE